MIENYRFLAVIPARGGSKSVPGKNIKLLGGKPLIAHTIEVAQTCNVFDEIVVSTDDEKITEEANRLQCRVIDRPQALSADQSKSEDAILHALDILNDQGDPPFDYVTLLEPTSPFRTPASVIAGCRAIVEKKGVSLLSVSEHSSTVGMISPAGTFQTLIKKQPRRRQDRKPVYSEAGVIYAAKVDYLRETGSLVSDRWLAHIVPSEEALDINSLEDFNLAELIWAGKNGQP